MREAKAVLVARVTAVWLHWICIATAITVLGGISLLSLLGYRLMVVTGPSMTPRFGPGDAVVVRPSGAEGVAVGDVITYRVQSDSGLTTHRVLAVRELDGKTWFQTKGDANRSPDPNLMAADGVYGRELMTLPGMGRPLLTAVSPWGKLAMLGFPVSYLIAQEVVVVFALRRRRSGHRSLAGAPGKAQDDLADNLAPGLEGRVGRNREDVIEMSQRLERTEAELRTQAFRLAALEAAFAARAVAGPVHQRSAGRLPAEAEGLLVLP